MPVDLSGDSIPAVYREVFEMFNSHGLNKLTFTVFVPLFESNTLTKSILNQVWYAVTKTSSIGSRNDLYKCLALMALAQQGKPIDEKLLDNYRDQELPIPIIYNINDLENRLIGTLRNSQETNTLCFRYNDLCALDTIQLNIVPEKKGVILKHVEYEIKSMRQKTKALRRYRDFLALHELLLLKYPYRIIPSLPPKKTVNVDKEFIEERRRSLKVYLQILCRHPIICDSDIIKFFLSFQGTSCGDDMKVAFKNVHDEFNAERRPSLNPMDSTEKYEEDANSVQMFHLSGAHMSLIHQYLNHIRGSMKSIIEKYAKNAEDLSNIEKSLETLGSDSTAIDRWATGPNDYWPRIQVGLADLSIEMSALSGRTKEQYKRGDEVINEHFDMLLELLLAYKDLCKRLEEALQNEQRASQKANNQPRRSLNATTDISAKYDGNLELIVKQNKYALRCVKTETQLVYANLEAFVHTLSGFGDSQSVGSSDFFQIWKSFANKVAQLGDDYIDKSAIQRKSDLH